jgi:hypothetical protein
MVSALAGLLSSMVVYALLRVIAFVWGHEPNPATLLYSAHAAYFWRVWTSAYAGTMISILVWIVSRGREARVLSVIRALAWPAVAILVLQSVLVP